MGLDAGYADEYHSQRGAGGKGRRSSTPIFYREKGKKNFLCALWLGRPGQKVAKMVVTLHWKVPAHTDVGRANHGNSLTGAYSDSGAVEDVKQDLQVGREDSL